MKCLITETCKNTIGGHECIFKECSKGETLNHANGKCEDIDECLTKNCGKNKKCVNYQGSFNCECNEGFELDKKSNLCVDINECTVHPGMLLEYFTLIFQSRIVLLNEVFNKLFSLF